MPPHIELVGGPWDGAGVYAMVDTHGLLEAERVYVRADPQKRGPLGMALCATAPGVEYARANSDDEDCVRFVYRCDGSDLLDRMELEAAHA